MHSAKKWVYKICCIIAEGPCSSIVKYTRAGSTAQAQFGWQHHNGELCAGSAAINQKRACATKPVLISRLRCSATLESARLKRKLRPANDRTVSDNHECNLPHFLSLVSILQINNLLSMLLKIRFQKYHHTYINIKISDIMYIYRVLTILTQHRKYNFNI